MKLMRVNLRRDGIHVWTSRMSGETMHIEDHRFPRYPKQYGRVVAITPAAMYEDPPGTMFEAMRRLVRNVIKTDELLRSKGKKGLDFGTLSFHHVRPDNEGDSCDPFLSDGEPGTDHRNALVGWKASSK